MSIFTASSNNAGPSWKFWASIAALLFSIYKLMTGPVFGDAVFPFIISLLLFFSEAKFIPSRFSSDLRYFFKYGDKYARLTIFIIAIGGTALTVKLFAGLSLIPDSVDFWFKRAGPALVAIAVVLYVSSILSKITFYQSEIRNDVGINRFEFLYYISVIFFSFSLTLLCMGLPYMDTIVASDGARQPGPYSWNSTNVKVLSCVTIVSFIWLFCYGLCVVSRFTEWFLRERYSENVHAQNGNLAPHDSETKLYDAG